MAQHIGIVACSAEGAALCYKTICVEGARLLGPHAHPEISMHTHSLADYVECLDRGDRRSVADLMLSSAGKLAASGADFLICPDNTIHQAMGLVVPSSPLPWLHIAEVVADEAAGRGFRRLGITGTRWLVDSDVYPEKLSARGLSWIRPTNAERDEANRVWQESLTQVIGAPGSLTGGDNPFQPRSLGERRCGSARVRRLCDTRADRLTGCRTYVDRLRLRGAAGRVLERDLAVCTCALVDRCRWQRHQGGTQ